MNSFFKNKRFYLVISIFLFILSSLLLTYLFEGDKGISNVQVTNITSTSITVVWETEKPTNGEILFGKDNDWKLLEPLFTDKQTAYDDRDLITNEDGSLSYNKETSTERTIHHVTIRDLEPSTSYYFRIKGNLKAFKSDINTFATTDLIEEIVQPDTAYGSISDYALLDDVDPEEVQVDGIVVAYLASANGTRLSPFISTTLANGSYNLDLNTWSRFASFDAGNLVVMARTEKGDGEQVFTLADGYKPLGNLFINFAYQPDPENIIPLDVAATDVKVIDKSEFPYGDVSVSAVGPCSITCSGGATFSDANPSTFSSCSHWAGEACATVGQTPSGSGGGSTPTNNNSSSTNTSQPAPPVNSSNNTNTSRWTCAQNFGNTCIDTNGTSRCLSTYLEACGSGLWRRIECGAGGEFYDRHQCIFDSSGNVKTTAAEANNAKTCPLGSFDYDGDGICTVGDDNQSTVEATNGGHNSTVHGDSIEEANNKVSAENPTANRPSSSSSTGGNQNSGQGGGGANMGCTHIYEATARRACNEAARSQSGASSGGGSIMPITVLTLAEISGPNGACVQMGGVVEEGTDFAGSYVCEIDGTPHPYATCFTETTCTISIAFENTVLSTLQNQSGEEEAGVEQGSTVARSSFTNTNCTVGQTTGTLSISESGSYVRCVYTNLVPSEFIYAICTSETSCTVVPTFTSSVQAVINGENNNQNTNIASCPALTNVCPQANASEAVTISNDGANPDLLNRCFYNASRNGFNYSFNIQHSNQATMQEALRNRTSEVCGNLADQQHDASSNPDQVQQCDNNFLNNTTCDTFPSCSLPSGYDISADKGGTGRHFNDSRYCTYYLDTPDGRGIEITRGNFTCSTLLNYTAATNRYIIGSEYSSNVCEMAQERADMSFNNESTPLCSAVSSNGNITLPDGSTRVIGEPYNGEFEAQCDGNSGGGKILTCRQGTSANDGYLYCCPANKIYNGSSCVNRTSSLKETTKSLFSKVSAQSSAPNPEAIDPSELDEGVYEIDIEGFETTEIKIYADSIDIKYFIDANGDGVKQQDELEVDPDLWNVTVTKKAELSSYNINKGWNLIALNFNNPLYATSSNLIDALWAQNIEAVQISKYSAGKWIHYVARIDANGAKVEYGNNFNLTPGESYFIRSLGSGKLVLSGNLFTSSVPISMKTGWNLIGVQTPGKTYTAGSFLSMCTAQGAQCTNISKFENGRYESTVKEDGTLFGNDYKLTNKKGYFVFNKGAAKTFKP